jgi:hypothetical protein
MTFDARRRRLLAGSAIFAVAGSGASDQVTGKYRGTCGRIGAGLGGTARMPVLVSAWTDVGEVKGAGLSAGFAFRAWSNGGAGSTAPLPSS